MTLALMVAEGRLDALAGAAEALYQVHGRELPAEVALASTPDVVRMYVTLYGRVRPPPPPERRRRRRSLARGA